MHAHANFLFCHTRKTHQTASARKEQDRSADRSLSRSGAIRYPMYYQSVTDTLVPSVHFRTPVFWEGQKNALLLYKQNIVV